MLIVLKKLGRGIIKLRIAATNIPYWIKLLLDFIFGIIIAGVFGIGGLIYHVSGVSDVVQDPCSSCLIPWQYHLVALVVSYLICFLYTTSDEFNEGYGA